MSATGQALPSMQGVYCSMEAEHMARREFQNPSILERETPRGTDHGARNKPKLSQTRAEQDRTRQEAAGV